MDAPVSSIRLSWRVEVLLLRGQRCIHVTADCPRLYRGGLAGVFDVLGKS